MLRSPKKKRPRYLKVLVLTRVSASLKSAYVGYSRGDNQGVDLSLLQIRCLEKAKRPRTPMGSSVGVDNLGKVCVLGAIMAQAVIKKVRRYQKRR